jgi:hypothetical protein
MSTEIYMSKRKYEAIIYNTVHGVGTLSPLMSSANEQSTFLQRLPSGGWAGVRIRRSQRTIISSDGEGSSRATFTHRLGIGPRLGGGPKPVR